MILNFVRRSKNYLYVFFYFFSSIIYSQNFVFKEYNVNEGLPSSQVYDIYQDKNNIIWFATNRGIANFNGYEFNSFGVKNGLPGNVVLDFFPQTNGEIWCATFNHKIFSFNEKFNGFQEFKYNDKIQEIIQSYTQRIESIYVDENDTVYLGLAGSISLIIIDRNGNISTPDLYSQKNKHIDLLIDEKGRSFFYFNTKPDEAFKAVKSFKSTAIKSYLEIKAIYLQKNDRCVFLKDKGVEIVDHHNEIVRSIKSEHESVDIHALDTEHFIIGYRNGGAHLLNSNGEVLFTFLNNKTVTSILVDHEEGLWFTTLNSGVYYLKNKELQLFEDASNPNVGVNSLTKNKEGHLFIGYRNGNVVTIDDKKQLTPINTFYGDHFNGNVQYNDKANGLYYSTLNSAYFLENKKHKFIDSGYFLKFSESQDERMLIARPGLLLATERDSIDFYKIVSFRIHDACFWKDDVIMGTPKGAFVYKSKEKCVEQLETHPLLKSRIEDIDLNYERDKLYLATMGNGLVIYNGNEVQNINQQDGLFSDLINEVYIEDDHTIWVSTNGGVNKIAFTKDGSYKISGINKTQGLVTNEVKDIEIINDTVWIGTKKGLMYVPKYFFDKNNLHHGTKQQLKHIKINDTIISKNKLNKLSYKDNYISFFVEDISFKKEGNIMYHYTLEGLNDTWYATKNRAINFSSLPPGNYIFKVTSCDVEVNCDKHILTQSFKIWPPFWKTWWFRTIVTLLIGAIIYFFFKVRILSYNKDVFREVLRLLIKRLLKKEKYLLFRESGQNVRIKTSDIVYIKSSGNYVDIVTGKEQFTVRQKIGEFIASTPDPLEYVRIHRSFIIRLEKTRSKSRTEIVMTNGAVLPVSKKYIEELQKIHFAA